MPYNKAIDERIRNVLMGWNTLDQRKMFGGTCYLLNGNMVCGVWKDYLILRMGEAASKALENPHTRPFDITGRPMKGWIMVDEDGFPDEQSLQDWLVRAKRFVDTLPPK